SSSSAPVIIGVGCAVLAVLVIIVVVVVALASGGEEDRTLPLPTYTPPTPTSSSTFSAENGITGTYTGTGFQPGAPTGRTTFKTRFFLIRSAGNATYTYDDSETCRTMLSLLRSSSTDSKIVYQETPFSGSSDKECAAGYLTFQPSPSGLYLRWEWRTTLDSSTRALAFGTVYRQ
ncbi:MAG: serine/threonine protein kinase, partial [Actinomadura rubrobrunea]|nr:serine/threonine protein kinase [Actinomadura rubrobrunea]